MPPTEKVPIWTTRVWNTIKDADWSSGGWDINGSKCRLEIVSEGGTDYWGMDFEPYPDPDPPNVVFMPESEWSSISGGTLSTERNKIFKSETYYEVKAVSDGNGWTADVVAS